VPSRPPCLCALSKSLRQLTLLYPMLRVCVLYTEIVQHVLQFLGPKELLCRVLPLNRHMNQLANDNALWKSLCMCVILPISLSISLSRFFVVYLFLLFV
jgi:hypothetical protein